MRDVFTKVSSQVKEGGMLHIMVYNKNKIMNMMVIEEIRLLENTRNGKNYHLKKRSKFVKIRLKQMEEIFMAGLMPLIQKLV